MLFKEELMTPQAIEHEAPLGVRRRDAEAEEGEPRGQDGADTDQARRVDQDRPKHIGQYVVVDHLQSRGARRARRLHEIEVPRLRRDRG